MTLKTSVSLEIDNRDHLLIVEFSDDDGVFDVVGLEVVDLAARCTRPTVPAWVWGAVADDLKDQGEIYQAMLGASTDHAIATIGG